MDLKIKVLISCLIATLLLGLGLVLEPVHGMPTTNSQTRFNENDCPRGPSFFDGCNWCYCSNARYLCTVRYCPGQGESTGFGFTGTRVFGIPYRGSGY